jgi:hypothetical protein
MAQTLFDGFANDHGGLKRRQAHRPAMVIGSQICPDFSSGTPIAFSKIQAAANRGVPNV